MCMGEQLHAVALSHQMHQLLIMYVGYQRKTLHTKEEDQAEGTRLREIKNESFSWRQEGVTDAEVA